MRLKVGQINKIKKDIRRKISSGVDINELFVSIQTEYSINLQSNRSDIKEIADIIKNTPSPSTKKRYRRSLYLLKTCLIILIIILFLNEQDTLTLITNSGLPIFSIITAFILTLFFPLLYFISIFTIHLSKPKLLKTLAWLCIFDIIRFLPLTGLYLSDKGLYFVAALILKIIISIYCFSLSMNLTNPYEYHHSYYINKSGIRKKKLIIKFLAKFTSK